MSGNFLKNYLARVQNRPPHERELLALLWAGGITLLIIIVWGLNTLYLIATPTPEPPETRTVAETSLWQSLTANALLVEEGLGVVREQFRAILTR